MRKKQLTRLIASAVLFTGLTTAANAQNTASAKAYAEIIKPISIAKVLDMDFGSIIASPTLVGAVQLNTDDTRSLSGGVLEGTGRTPAAAKFTVTGMKGLAFEVTLPQSVELTNTSATGNGEKMTAYKFTTNFTDNKGVLSGTSATGSGTEDLLVGATLKVGADQAEGLYVSSDFDVTVNYY